MNLRLLSCSFMNLHAFRSPIKSTTKSSIAGGENMAFYGTGESPRTLPLTQFSFTYVLNISELTLPYFQSLQVRIVCSWDQNDLHLIHRLMQSERVCHMMMPLFLRLRLRTQKRFHRSFAPHMVMFVSLHLKILCNYICSSEPFGEFYIPFWPEEFSAVADEFIFWSNVPNSFIILWISVPDNLQDSRLN